VWPREHTRRAGSFGRTGDGDLPLTCTSPNRSAGTGGRGSIEGTTRAARSDALAPVPFDHVAADSAGPGHVQLDRSECDPYRDRRIHRMAPGGHRDAARLDDEGLHGGAGAAGSHGNWTMRFRVWWYWRPFGRSTRVLGRRCRAPWSGRPCAPAFPPGGRIWR
jgi:hypothetical protein